MNSRVPFLDLAAAHAELEEELVEVFRSALRTACFIGGPMVEGLEHDFAEFCGTKHCVGISSGTDALRFALMAAGVRAGDCVVTVPNTFIATTEAITQAHALPEFVDIDERTYNMDPAKLREYLEIAMRPRSSYPAAYFAKIGTAGHCRGSGPSIWANRRHGSDSRIGGDDTT